MEEEDIPAVAIVQSAGEVIGHPDEQQQEIVDEYALPVPPLERVYKRAESANQKEGWLSTPSGKKAIATYIAYSGFTGFLVEGYNQWLNEVLLHQIETDILTLLSGDQVRFSDLTITKPHYWVPGEVEPRRMYPEYARRNGLTLSMTLHARITMWNKVAGGYVADPNASEVIELGSIPIMVGSDAEWTSGLTHDEMLQVGEDPSEPKGLFVVKGLDRIVILKEMLRLNRFIAFRMNDTSANAVRFTVYTPKGSILMLMHVNSKTGELAFMSNALKKHYVFDKVREIIVPVARREQDKREANKKTGDNKVVKTKAEQYVQINVFLVLRHLLPEATTEELMERILAFVPKEQRSQVSTRLSATAALANRLGDPSDWIATQVDWSDGEEYKDALATLIIDDDIFPNLNDPLDTERAQLRRIHMVCMMTAMLGQVQAGLRSLDDRDAWGLKRLRTPADMCEALFRSVFRNIVNTLHEKIHSSSKTVIITTIAQVIANLNMSDITSTFLASFITRNWGPINGPQKFNVTQTLKRESRAAMYSHVTKVDVDTSREGQASIRNVQDDQNLYICPAETSDNANCGILKNLAVTCRITKNAPKSHHAIIEYLLDDRVDEVSSDGLNTVPILVDGIFIGFGDGLALRDELRSMKIGRVISEETGIVLDGYETLHVWTDGNRLVAPLLIVDDETNTVPGLNEDLLSQGWEAVVQNGCVEYVDAAEQKYILAAYTEQEIANAYRDNISAWVRCGEIRETINVYSRALKVKKIRARLNATVRQIRSGLANAKHAYRLALETYELTTKQMAFTHCFLDPQAILGITANLMPWPEHNPPPRVSFETGMEKSANGLPHFNHRDRVDEGTYRALESPEAPLEDSLVSRLMALPGNRSLVRGQTVMIAMIPFDSFGVEDAIIVNKNSVERGLFNYTKYTVLQAILEQDEVLGYDEISYPILNRHKDEEEKYHGISLPDGESLGGLPMIDAYLSEKDIWLGKTTLRGGESINTSVPLEIGDEGRVISVFVSRNSDRRLTVTAKLASSRIPIQGDKFSAPYSQKGVAGLMVPQEDFPYIMRDGSVPDMLVNPHALTSRVTASYLMQMLASAAGVISGERIDSSAFTDFEAGKFHDTLLKYGCSYTGAQYMIDGKRGGMLEVPIYYSPCFFLMLKQTVVDKIFGVGQGDNKSKNWQTQKGRQNGGGIKFSEMEGWALIGFGASDNIKERFSTLSDAVWIALCQGCGLVAQYEGRLGSWACKRCRGTSGAGKEVGIGRTVVPYGSLNIGAILAALGMVQTYGVNPVEETLVKGDVIGQDYELDEELQHALELSEREFENTEEKEVIDEEEEEEEAGEFNEETEF